MKGEHFMQENVIFVILPMSANHAEVLRRVLIQIISRDVPKTYGIRVSEIATYIFLDLKFNTKILIMVKYTIKASLLWRSKQ